MVNKGPWNGSDKDFLNIHWRPIILIFTVINKQQVNKFRVGENITFLWPFIYQECCCWRRGNILGSYLEGSRFEFILVNCEFMFLISPVLSIFSANTGYSDLNIQLFFSVTPSKRLDSTSIREMLFLPPSFPIQLYMSSYCLALYVV
jgi:hypothetical protein